MWDGRSPLLSGSDPWHRSNDIGFVDADGGQKWTFWAVVRVDGCRDLLHQIDGSGVLLVGF
jgi:hypothetical protein